MIIKFNHRVTDLEAIALPTDLITMIFKVLNLGLEKSNFSDFPIQEDHVSIIHGVLPTVNRYRLFFSFTVYRQ